MALENELIETTPQGGAIYVLHETEAVRAARRQLRDDLDQRFVITEGQVALLELVRQHSKRFRCLPDFLH
jgi:hypothetical protein